MEAVTHLINTLYEFREKRGASETKTRGVCVVIPVIVLILVNLSVTAHQKRIETLRGIVPICSYCKQIRGIGIRKKKNEA